ncbi:hypothetical protein J5N97_009427 [Dioscorea zingiberensis]|uniref:Nucleoporin NSP1-like C-terminal domain-containing protein n=1 Tax=Dioscorea zingiberensis TaxID=325984 RepID=A0A9D5CY72_9LILI|nr:hypothetical protein J5N97_009427 [Dioscorea zingiberensis]
MRGAVQNLLANPQFYRPPHIGKSSAIVAGVTPATSVSEPGSAFKRKTVEEIIKDWNSELQDRAAKFRKQATAIAEYMLMELSRRKKNARIKPDEDFDVFMKV